MAKNSPITEAHNWFTNEKKVFEFTLEGSGDISAYSMEWVFRSSATEDSYLIRKTTSDGVVVTDGPNRIVQVTVNAADTADLEPVNGAHALRRTDVGNEILFTYGDAMLQQAAAH